MSEDAPSPLDTVSNIPVISYGALVGRGEIKDGIMTVELDPKIGKDLVDYVRMGLINGINIAPVYVEANPTFQVHTVEMENNNG